MKKVYVFIQEKEKKKAYKEFCIFQSIIDKYAMKGIIHTNKASRYKSTLIKNIKKI